MSNYNYIVYIYTDNGFALADNQNNIVYNHGKAVTYGTRYFKAKILIDNLTIFAKKWLTNKEAMESFKRQYETYRLARSKVNILTELKNKEHKIEINSALSNSGFGDF